ncbi:hypothetical protein ORM30_20880 [Bacillus cereus]|nr:hypothetical protein [Bacillus cereus]
MEYVQNSLLNGSITPTRSRNTKTWSGGWADIFEGGDWTNVTIFLENITVSITPYDNNNNIYATCNYNLSSKVRQKPYYGPFFGPENLVRLYIYLQNDAGATLDQFSVKVPFDCNQVKIPVGYSTDLKDKKMLFDQMTKISLWMDVGNYDVIAEHC